MRVRWRETPLPLPGRDEWTKKKKSNAHLTPTELVLYNRSVTPIEEKKELWMICNS
jgi:hypothetical protein